MTSYSISVGYNSSKGARDVSAHMLKALQVLRSDPSKIVAEVLRLEPHCDAAMLATLADSYSLSNEDQTVFVRRADEDPTLIPFIVQNASGGGAARAVKESLRRAVCRLIMEACHREEMEININVN